ncbi:MAG: response regulator [Deferribacteraceae bacterium]|jgi:signal transduction histidine kinase/CheY-like chemotaxis protein/HAMP domain-containing protein|nr:response regulator [Deferribacteraceae bacterium]
MSKFNNIKLQSKLFVLFGGFFILLLFASIFIISKFLYVEHRYDLMMKNVVLRQIFLNRAVNDMTKLRLHNLSRMYLTLSGGKSDLGDEMYANYDDIIASFNKNMKDFRESLIADTDEFFTDYEKNKRLIFLNRMNYLFTYVYLPYLQELDDALMNNDHKQIYTLALKAIPVGNEITGMFEEIRDVAYHTFVYISTEVAHNSKFSRNEVFILIAFIGILFLLLSMSIARTIKKPISKIQNAMSEISKGNFDYPIRSEYRDEFGILSNFIGDMVDRILEMNKTMAVMDYLDCMINISDLNFNVVYINKKMAELYDLDRANIINQKCYKVLKGLDQPCPYCILPKLLSNEQFQAQKYDYFFEEKLGKWIGGKAAIINWVDGSPVQFHYLTDETVQKEYEEDLSNAKLAAETASVAKSAFLATMSHEIRTPMNAILGITEMLMENDTIANDVKEALSKIYNASDLLIGIINDILDLSKIEAGKLELMPEKYEIASVIYDTIYLNKIKYESKPIGFKIQVNESIPSVLYGDALRIKQILNNLLSNAFKYTNVGEVELSISSEFENIQNASANITLVFNIRDTGQGMTEDQINKLFDEYTRFNASANRLTEGTGLGMSITKNLVHLMNGNISVESVPDKGSLFIVRLPQMSMGNDVLGKDVVQNLQQSQVSNMSKVRKTQIIREYMPYGSILIVDDSDMNIYVAKGLMKPYGMQMDSVMSGFDAINRINAGKSYDIIFMDHMMPVMDGIEAVKILRNLGYSRPIVALTANAVVGQSDMFLANGFDGFISKPVDIRALNAILNKFIRDRHTPAVIEAARQQKLKEAKAPDAENNKKDNIKNFLDTLATISEINTVIGLSRFSGIETMYRDTMELFYKKLIPEYNRMTVFIDSGDIRNFTISVHAMKSSLSTVGAMSLSEMALKLELASKNGDTDYCSKQFPVFKEKLVSLQKCLTNVFPDTKIFTLKKEGDTPFLRENIENALDAGNDFDGDACAEAIKRVLDYDFGSEINTLVEEAIAAVNAFKLGDTVKILNKILSMT